ncbi:type VII secretion-associated serine protease mycosin [Solwaraspora sp. WMMD1047]|uniref:type VII secretion-associated serine protease mycosin n=1 Tax=Solwaraspora sp. WMMD1047 TaxID=3016102 RepID=UPI002416E799|nr:type VII secretion-associated serine protease mycosin [Solwaraspora sp. WMMD1047]MDG4833323.1 type VII secretion-associated serine protease mycosin [Solwaraspora sp. WMMD1047]
MRRRLFLAINILPLTAALLLPSPGVLKSNEVREQQWHLNSLAVTDAHKISRGQGVLVAVIDTGVDPHPDLVGNLQPGTDVYKGGTGDGRIDGDPNGHGTAMAGLIASHGTAPGDGTLGIAPEAAILPIRDSRQREEGSPDDLAKGIEWAVSKNAAIISISSSGTSSPALRSAIESAIKADTVVIASAGNKPAHYLIGFPAAIDGVVAVGAVDRNGLRATISVSGRELDISAPGVEIFSTRKNGGYAEGTGTSPAAAIVAGAAALVRSRFPELSAQEVVHRLTYTAVDKGAPGRDDEYGHGVLNLVAALTADVPPLNGTATPRATPPSTPADSAQPKEEPGDAVRSVLVSLLGVGLAVGLLVLGYRRHRRRNPL